MEVTIRYLANVKLKVGKIKEKKRRKKLFKEAC